MAERLHPTVGNRLKAIGIVALSKAQEECIEAVLKGENILIESRKQDAMTAFLASLISQSLGSFVEDSEDSSSQSMTAIAVIVAPTKLLAKHLYDRASRLATFSPVKPTLWCGGSPKATQKEQLNHKGQAIIIGTPGRLLDCIKSNIFTKAKTEGSDEVPLLKGLKYVALAGAEKLLREGALRDDADAIWARIKDLWEDGSPAVFVSADPLHNFVKEHAWINTSIQTPNGWRLEPLMYAFLLWSRARVHETVRAPTFIRPWDLWRGFAG